MTPTRAIHEGPQSLDANREYPCKLDVVNRARKELRAYELKGYKKHLKKAIAHLRAVLEME